MEDTDADAFLRLAFCNFFDMDGSGTFCQSQADLFNADVVAAFVPGALCRSKNYVGSASHGL